jgi:hypothetical protein
MTLPHNIMEFVVLISQNFYSRIILLLMVGNLLNVLFICIKLFFFQMIYFYYKCPIIEL